MDSFNIMGIGACIAVTLMALSFFVEISYCYSVKSPATDFEEEKYYSRIIISVPCNSPKEAVNYAMSRWEDEAKKEKNVKTTMFNVYYDFRFINVVRVSV